MATENTNETTDALLSRSQEAANGLLRTADLLRRRYSQALEPHGLTMQQYNVLRILKGAKGRPLPTLDIGARLIEQAPGITRLIDRLDEKALVRRERSPEDRRVVNCHITALGLQLLSGLEAEVDRIDELAVSGFEDDDTDAFIETLEAIRLNLQ